LALPELSINVIEDTLLSFSLRRVVGIGNCMKRVEEPRKERKKLVLTDFVT
jgi:hypothetical protein